MPRMSLLLIALFCLSRAGFAADESSAAADSTVPARQRSAAKSPDPPGTRRLAQEYEAWIDTKNKRVIVDGVVCLRQGQLEMFACLKGTKEHESIISVDCKAYIIHAALLAIGAKSGTPVEFQPLYKPATGTTIDVTCIWTDE